MKECVKLRIASLPHTHTSESAPSPPPKPRHGAVVTVATPARQWERRWERQQSADQNSAPRAGTRRDRAYAIVRVETRHAPPHPPSYLSHVGWFVFLLSNFEAAEEGSE